MLRLWGGLPKKVGQISWVEKEGKKGCPSKGTKMQELEEGKGSGSCD